MASITVTIGFTVAQQTQRFVITQMHRRPYQNFYKRCFILYLQEKLLTRWPKKWILYIGSDNLPIVSHIGIIHQED